MIFEHPFCQTVLSHKRAGRITLDTFLEVRGLHKLRSETAGAESDECSQEHTRGRFRGEGRTFASRQRKEACRILSALSLATVRSVKPAFSFPTRRMLSQESTSQRCSTTTGQFLSIRTNDHLLLAPENYLRFPVMPACQRLSSKCEGFTSPR